MSSLRDFENVPLKDDIDTYFEREVRPHVPDAWMDRSKDKVGYEINFNRHFYKYTPPRPLEVIDAELKQAEEEIMRLLRGGDRMSAVAEKTDTNISGWLGNRPSSDMRQLALMDAGIPLNIEQRSRRKGKSTRIGVPTESLILLMNIFSMSLWS